MIAMARMALVFLGASLLSCGSCAPPQPKARRDLTMTIVYDNSPYDKKLETKWGFGCLITGPEKTLWCFRTSTATTRAA